MNQKDGLGGKLDGVGVKVTDAVAVGAEDGGMAVPVSTALPAPR